MRLKNIAFNILIFFYIIFNYRYVSDLLKKDLDRETASRLPQGSFIPFAAQNPIKQDLLPQKGL